MEMMVVLLIVAIIAAASAPMVTKKLSRNAGTGDSPWVFTGLNNSIAYNMNGNNNSAVIIGTAALPDSLEESVRLFIDSGNNAAHIAFGNGEEEPLLLTADPAQGRIGFSNEEIPTRTIAFGVNQTINAGTEGGTILGFGSRINGNSPVAIGANASATTNSVAIGGNDWGTVMYNYEIRVRYRRGLRYRNKDVTVMADNDETAKNTALSSVIAANKTATVLSKTQCFGTEASGSSSTAVGHYASGKGRDSVALGHGASARDQRAVGIGMSASASANASVAIGEWSGATSSGAVAIGSRSSGDGTDSIAIGVDAMASGTNSVAIGTNANAEEDNQIVLGDENATVYIRGNLIVGRNAQIGNDLTLDDLKRTYGSGRFSRSKAKAGLFIKTVNMDGALTSGWVSVHDSRNVKTSGALDISDRRLKNIGGKYTAGLAELKKLDFFHFTFKEDKEKTPHVGVMAQDLEKVFPDAVTKGEDGYLRIRLEDMFYAVINAVKELDNKIAEIVQNITDINSTIEKQNKTIEEQQKTIDELVKRIEKLEKQK